jgi:hypothetical protein
MDLPPTIPTSFVPQSASAAARRFRSDFTGAFGFLAYGVLAVVLALAIGVFFYGRILAATQAGKDTALTKAEAAIDPATVVGFVRLRDRLNSGATLLANHVAFSGFFTLLETLQPTTVRLTSLHLALDDAKKVKLEGSGTAKSFNALAAASTAFATDGRIKEAIFSNIVVNKDSSVSFALAATLAPSLVTFSP